MRARPAKRDLTRLTIHVCCSIPFVTNLSTANSIKNVAHRPVRKRKSLTFQLLGKKLFTFTCFRSQKANTVKSLVISKI